MTHHRPHDTDEPPELEPEDLDQDAPEAGSIAQPKTLAKDAGGFGDHEDEADGPEVGAIESGEW